MRNSLQAMTLLLAISLLNANSVQACEVVEFSSERISDDVVSVTGYVSKPFKRVHAKVLRFSKVIGSGKNRSENTGYFNVKVHTRKKASRRPYVTVSCLQ